MWSGHQVRRIILTALFTALSVVLGYLLAGVPNIELMTLSVFLAGIYIGCRLGALVGMFSILFYSLFNPYGPPLLPLAVAQVAGFALVGVTGGFMGPRIKRGDRAAVGISAVAGFLLTFGYDILTTLATALIALGSHGFVAGLPGVLIAGAVFVIFHVVSNTVVFAVAVVPVVRVVTVWEGRHAP